jgi:transglutaminase-like putative cysteine protease
MMSCKTLLFYLTMLFLNLSLKAQQTNMDINVKLPDTKGYERNPILLANKLTEGLYTEKEKFDVIFTWVTKNIKYDYRRYKLPQGARNPKIKQLLKSKKGMCLDYSFLMDTLCKIAGVTNVTVYG